MDWVRSCYTVPMVMRVGDPAVLVKWYFADDDAKVLEAWTPFRSSNWAPGEDDVDDLGEQPGPRGWANGKKPANGWTGDANSQACAESHADWWEDGLGVGEDTGPFYSPGVPDCCFDGPPPPEMPCVDCAAVPDVDMVISFECPGCPDLDGTSWPLNWNSFPGNWTINGQQFLPSCSPPNFGAITVNRVLATEPCELQFDGAQLFCFGMGIISAVATCDDEGGFLHCEWSGSFSGAPDGCDTMPFTARMVVA